MGVTKRTFDFPFRWEIEKLKKKKKKKRRKRIFALKILFPGANVDFYTELFIQEITSRSFAEGS